MALSLDVRQRAMLQAMGVRVWQPAAPVADVASAPELIATNADRTSVKAELEHQPKLDKALVAPPNPTMPAMPRARQDAAPIRAAGPPAVPAVSVPTEPVAPVAPISASAVEACWLIGPAQTLFADAVQAGGARWLVLVQVPPAALSAPAFDGDAGRLLFNMLRATRLHQGAGAVVFAPLVRQAISGLTDEFSAALSSLIGQAQPDIVLIMGRLAGQALLASNEPFGKLRGRPHDLQGRTAVVTYDADYLLRCPQDKARAWDDLCLAMRLASSLAPSSATPSA